MANAEQLRVLVVDENPLTRFGILSVVNLHPLLHVCEEAADARSARALHSTEFPQIVVLDIVLPHGDGIELLREFASFTPKCRSVVVTELCDPAVVQRAFQAGAQGYVSKKDEVAEILAALNAVSTGGTYVSKIVSAGLQVDLGRKIPGRTLKLLGNLSDREFHVFRRMAKGQGATEIARELGISVKTVETHLGRIKEKLHLSTSEQLHRTAESWLASVSERKASDI